MASPFSLVIGDSIYARITAINGYGTSLVSVPGDGEAMVVLPDAPLNLQNNPAITSATSIGLQWSSGLSNGGKTVLDHTISYDKGFGYEVLVESVDSLAYTAEQMTPGVTYKFKVQARNQVGLSPFSEEVSILAA